MTLIFVETTGFTSSVAEFFDSDENYRFFQNALLENPDRGDVIQGAGGLRKVRWANSQRGKGARGGIRVIYLHVPEKHTVIFIRAYSKDKQNDLTTEQRKRYAQIAEAIRQEMLKP